VLDYFGFSHQEYSWFSVVFSDENPKWKMNRNIINFPKVIRDIFLSGFYIVFHVYLEQDNTWKIVRKSIIYGRIFLPGLSWDYPT
jgi:hypothetical protein